MKMLLPVDGSDPSKRMLAYIAAHDELLGAAHEYTFLTVVPSIPAHAARFVDPGTLEAHYADQAQQVLEPVCAFADQQGWRYRSIGAHGHAAVEIARVAEDGGYDLVVMGSHGHTALGNVLLGSVATGVLSRCKLPILLVR